MAYVALFKLPHVMSKTNHHFISFNMSIKFHKIFGNGKAMYYSNQLCRFSSIISLLLPGPLGEIMSIIISYIILYSFTPVLNIQPRAAASYKDTDEEVVLFVPFRIANFLELTAQD